MTTPTTTPTQPANEWLSTENHPVWGPVVNCDRCEATSTDTVEEHLERHYDGPVYPHFAEMSA